MLTYGVRRYAVAFLLFLAGCGEYRPDHTLTDVQPNSSLPMVEAERLAETNAVFMQAMFGRRFGLSQSLGASMRPAMPMNGWLVYEVVGIDDVGAGDWVLYAQDDGMLVGHRLIRREASGWVAKGDNNRYEDKERVTSDNLVGRVVIVFYPSQQ